MKISTAPTQSFAPTAYEVNNFLRFFCAAMLSVGSNTSRVNRAAMRIAAAYGFKAEVILFSKHLMLFITAFDDKDHCSAIGPISAGPPDFQKLAKLNALSWKIVDEHISLTKADEECHAILNMPRYNLIFTGFMASCANASFCKLFGGDAVAMLLVFFATFCVFFLKWLLTSRHFESRIIIFICAFAVSLLISPAVLFEMGLTASTALASSVLFLIPGIPLINSILDILDGHILMGISRGIHASILIACIAFGLALTMYITGISSI